MGHSPCSALVSLDLIKRMIFVLDFMPDLFSMYYIDICKRAAENSVWNMQLV
jgi:hypothetical protein